MDLFEHLYDSEENLLPRDGEVTFFGRIFTPEESGAYFDELFNSIEWKNDEAVIFGKRIQTKRKVAWYGEQEFEYTYSNTTKVALPFTQTLSELKAITEAKTGESYNACLLNLYHDGTEGMAWHSDGETDLKKNGAIASLSFGAERKFSFKHKETKETVSLQLTHGSLLVMKGVLTPRINLTFRTIVR